MPQERDLWENCFLLVIRRHYFFTNAVVTQAVPILSLLFTKESSCVPWRPVFGLMPENMEDLSRKNYQDVEYML